MADTTRVSLISTEDYEGVVFDVVENARTSFKTKWTNHPIDSKSNVSDHAIDDPTSITLTIAQTDTPVSFTRAVVGLGSSFIAGQVVAGLGSPILGAAGAFGVGKFAESLVDSDQQVKRSKSLVDMLRDWQSRHVPMQVITKFIQLNQMGIENFDIIENSNNGGGLEGTISLKQLFIGVSETEPIPAENLRHTAKKTKKTGTKASIPAKASTTAVAQNKSVFFSFIE